MKYALKQLSHQVFGCGSYAYKDTQSQDGQNLIFPLTTLTSPCIPMTGVKLEDPAACTGTQTDRFIQLQDGSFMPSP